jgi:ergothioneine biosynthesis protein EgtB
MTKDARPWWGAIQSVFLEEAHMAPKCAVSHHHPAVQPIARATDYATVAAFYDAVRRQTEALCEPLEVEDYVIQSMPDASPVKWHLAHTTWFFETFVLLPHVPGYRPFHPQFGFLFNSYYHTVGPRWARHQRGLLSRPTVAEIYRYRASVDEEMAKLLRQAHTTEFKDIARVVVLGLHHEQQHQELIVTDLKHAWAANPLHPVYRAAAPEKDYAAPTLPSPCARESVVWRAFPEGLSWIGNSPTHPSLIDGKVQAGGFAFDNESPRHRVFLDAFQLSSRLITNAEYRAFMADGGYQRPELWLSDGWATRQTREWTAPLYWEDRDGKWSVITLAGLQPLNPAEPVCHVSFYEADAFARWAGARLPTEAEWETAAAAAPVTGHFLEGGRFHPTAQTLPLAQGNGSEGEGGGLFHQLYGDVWQWTASPYVGYPGYEPPTGALGEYNGKFMCNQFVLRGASCATPRSHARRTYRNFFPPDVRWQFSGIRLAKELT